MTHSIPPESMTTERDQRLIDHDLRRDAAERFGEHHEYDGRLMSQAIQSQQESYLWGQIAKHLIDSQKGLNAMLTAYTRLTPEMRTVIRRQREVLGPVIADVVEKQEALKERARQLEMEAKR